MKIINNCIIQKCTNGVGEWETFDEDGCPIETFDTYEQALDCLKKYKEEEKADLLTFQQFDFERTTNGTI